MFTAPNRGLPVADPIFLLRSRDTPGRGEITFFNGCPVCHTSGVPDDFVIARNPDPDSTLPFLVRIPVGEHGIVLKVRDTWPRTSKVYCHRAPGWPDDPEILERVPVRSCVRRGAAIDLVLDRGRENRSQFVITRIRGGREAIFWQSPRTTKAARPNVPLPTGRAQGLSGMVVLVDSHERYAYTFKRQSGRGHVETVRRGLPAGTMRWNSTAGSWSPWNASRWPTCPAAC